MFNSPSYNKLSPDYARLVDSMTDYHAKNFLLLQEDERQKARANRKTPRLNPDSLLLDLAGGNLNGENREALAEGARRDGVPFDPVRPYVSFRDLTVATGTAGGFLVQTDVQPSIDILRPWSVMARSGVQIEFGLTGNAVVPKVSAKSTPNWLPTEGSTATASYPTLTQVALTPKTVSGFLQYSRQLSKQANAQAFASRELLRTVGTAIDQAIINGSGVSGQPTGIIGTTGVQTQSGTTLNSGCATMKRKAAEANVVDTQISFLSTPVVRELLEGREKATGGGKFVWDKDLVADRPAFVTTDMPTGYMICADFSLVYLGFWGSGMFLEINPFDSTLFKSGVIQARVLTTCDVAVLHPPAFIVASSIT